MNNRKWICLLLSLCMALVCLGGIAEGEPDGDYGDFDVEYLGSMRVVNCDEWVSLRDAPNQNAKRLAKVPLDAVVSFCIVETDDYCFCEYNGQTGYILRKYLEAAWLKEARTNYSGYRKISSDKVEGELLLEFQHEQLVVFITHDRAGDGEAIWINAYLGGGVEPLWGYMSTCYPVGELDGVTAFMGGTAQDPKLLVYNSHVGLTMFDIWTGDTLWLLGTEECNLGSSITHAVRDDGTMYIAGYYGPDPVAISREGNVLWKADTGRDDLYWPFSMLLTEEGIYVWYEGGSDSGYQAALFSYEGVLKDVQPVQE